MTDDDEIREDRRVIEAAAGGPWETKTIRMGDRVTVDALVIAPNAASFRDQVADCYDNTAASDSECEANAAFIARARTRWPAALDEVDRLRQMVDDTYVRKLLEALGVDTIAKAIARAERLRTLERHVDELAKSMGGAH